jgi:hypothetical protein
MDRETFEIFNLALAAGDTAAKSLLIQSPHSALYHQWIHDIEQARIRLIAMRSRALITEFQTTKPQQAGL